MGTVTRLTAFAALLALAFGGAALAGAAIDPTDPGETDPAPHMAADAEMAEGHEPGAGSPAADGLAVSAAGYTLRPARADFASGRPQRFAFEILGPDGRPVRGGYEPIHERELHLIVVRRDTATFTHAHPRRAGDGTWATQLTFPLPGAYRVFADFRHKGDSQTLATDVFVTGPFAPRPLPAPRSHAAAEGFDVELRGATDLGAGRERRLTFVVARGGRPVARLEDYLGAKGHLVALREGDLAYLHAHPLAAEAHGGGGDEEPAGGAGEVPFAVTFPTAGRYRLFLQFKVGGRVRTVDYTVEVER